MTKEMLHRMKTAGEYQRKAIRALFPEEMGGHLDVIEKEMKMMVMEAVAELLKGCNKEDANKDDANKEDANKDGQSHEQTSKAKKINID